MADSAEPGLYAGITSTGIFGRLTCSSGKRAKPANRVFFAAWDDALAAGFRPCKRCRPEPMDTYERGADGRWRLLVERLDVICRAQRRSAGAGSR